MNSTHILLTSLVDYAGLFPPAGLPVREAVNAYAKHREGPHAWMLGRFVLPLAKIDDFANAAQPLLPTDEHDEPWPITAIVSERLNEDIDTIFAFNRTHAESRHNGLAVIDSVELRAGGPAHIDRAMRTIPEQITPYFELPTDGELRGLLAALAGTGGRAKIRCGGLTKDAFPDPQRVARFIHLCHAADVPFKATAGLHHPLRSTRPATADPDAPTVAMHGFLNLFLAAAFVRLEHIPETDTNKLLDETRHDAFTFEDDRVTWRGRSLDSTRLAMARESFAISFGSCSFDEPAADLATLGFSLEPPRNTESPGD